MKNLKSTLFTGSLIPRSLLQGKWIQDSLVPSPPPQLWLLTVRITLRGVLQVTIAAVED